MATSTTCHASWKALAKRCDGWHRSSLSPYVKTNKNDVADAEEICEAVVRPNTRFVPIKNVYQQLELALHRVRQGFVTVRMAQTVTRNMKNDTVARNESKRTVYTVSPRRRQYGVNRTLTLMEAACWTNAGRKFSGFHPRHGSSVAADALARIRAPDKVESSVHGKPLDERWQTPYRRPLSRAT